MRRPAFLAIGVILVLLGVLWTLQGLDVIGGSAMSGRGMWAVIGPVVAVVGVVVGLLGARRPPGDTGH